MPTPNVQKASALMKKEIFSIKERIDLIVQIDKKLIEISKEVKSKNWDSLNDSRMLFFRYITELNSITILQYAFQAESYSKTKDKTWLKERFPHMEKQINEISNIEEYSSNRNNNISNHIWDTFILNYFHEFETRLRSIVRNLKNVKNLQHTKKRANLNGNESFYWIYRGLFEDYLSFNKSDYEVLKIFSIIRNTVHNSGIFFSPSNKGSLTVSYGGKTYQVVNGKPVNFVTSEFVKTMLFDLLELWKKLLLDPNINKIKFIQDPIASVKFE